MARPSPTWDAAYRHGRRKARHRCRCCNRILAAGEPAVMTRVSSRAVWVIHQACGDVRHGTSRDTWRVAMAAWGNTYLDACGWAPLSNKESLNGE